MKRPDGVPVKVENTGVLVLVKDLKDKGPGRSSTLPE